MTVRRILWNVAAALALAGVALRVAPTRGAPPAADPAPSLTPQPLPPAPAAAATGQGIVAANVFSAGRAAPRVRFAPPGTAVADRAAPPVRPAFTLYGITVTSQGALALIDADPRIPGAELYRVGDLAGGARLSAITDSTVTLVQPSGPLVLRLSPGSRRNP